MKDASFPPLSPTVLGKDALIRLQNVLRTTEELASDNSGVLSLRIGDLTDTIVCVQCGRVCWATSRRMKGRLPKLFQHYASEDGSVLIDHLIAEIRQSKGSLERAFRESGIDEQSLRLTLRQHTIEALASTGVDFVPSWTPHSQGTYGAKHLFSGAELLSKASEWLLSEQTIRAKSELQQVLRGATTGLSFERLGRGDLVLLVAAHAGSLSIKKVFDTGRCATEILDLSSSFCPSDRVTCTTTPFGVDIVTWMSGSIVHCLLCPDSALLAAKLTSVARLLQLSEPSQDLRPSGTQPISGR